jgi:hypothetical protein
MEKRLVLVAIEERPVSDHVEALIKPGANQLAENHLGLTKPLTGQADEPDDHLDEVIEIENCDPPPTCAEAFTKPTSHGALS